MFGLGVQLPGVVEQIAPAEVDNAPGFSEPGAYPFYCHEYYGALHHTMSGSVNVIEVEQQ